LCLLIALGSAFASARAWLSPSAPVTVADDDEDDVQVLVLTLRPTGFEPSEAALTKGKHLLVVQNRTGLESFTLRLDRENGGKLHEVRLSRKLDWRQQFDLMPGSYVLTEAEHPDWTCRITVNAR
jgi:hypothetical protein